MTSSLQTMPRESYVYRDGQLIPKHLAPPRHRASSGLQVIKDIEPYQNIAVDGKTIGGRRQHRDMLKAHGLVEVGDQAPRTPPRVPENRRDMSLIHDLKRAMGKL